MTCPLLQLSQPEQSEGAQAPVTQTSDAKSSVDDLGAGRGVVHGRAVPNSHCDLLRLSPSYKTGRFVLPEQASLGPWVRIFGAAGVYVCVWFSVFELMYIIYIKKKGRRARCI